MIDDENIDCETLHGLPCETAVLEISQETDQRLPVGELVEYGYARELVFVDAGDRDSDDERDLIPHRFGPDTVIYVAGPNILYIVGDLQITELGIEG